MAAGACAAAVGVLGLSGMAQAQTGTIVAATPSTTVAAGVETAIKLTLPAGCTGPVTVKGFPAPNGSTTNLLQVDHGGADRQAGRRMAPAIPRPAGLHPDHHLRQQQDRQRDGH
jgi:hypothetical protein